MDTDGDGIGDNSDTDDDGDGWLDTDGPAVPTHSWQPTSHRTGTLMGSRRMGLPPWIWGALPAWLACCALSGPWRGGLDGSKEAGHTL